MKLLWGILIFAPLLLRAAQPEYSWTTILPEPDMQYVVDAELSPDGDVVIMGWKGSFEFYVAKYSLEGERRWKYEFHDDQVAYDIYPITNPRGDLVVYGISEGSRYSFFYKLSAAGELLDQLTVSYDLGLSVLNYTTVDSLNTDKFAAAVVSMRLDGPPVFGYMDWNHMLQWYHLIRQIRVSKLSDDVVLVNDRELVVVNQRCYNSEVVRVRCPKGEQSELTLVRIERDDSSETVQNLSISPGLRMIQLHRLADGYLLLGYVKPETEYASRLDFCAVRLGTNGDTLWTGIYEEAVDCAFVSGPKDALETADGRLYVLSQNRGPGSFDLPEELGFLITELSPAGEKLSSMCYGAGEFNPERLLRLSDDEFILVGSRHKNDKYPYTFFMCFRYQ